MNEQIKHLRLDRDDLTLSPQFMLRNIDLEIGEAEIQGNPRLRGGSSDTCCAWLTCWFKHTTLRHSKSPTDLDYHIGSNSRCPLRVKSGHLATRKTACPLLVQKRTLLCRTRYVRFVPIADMSGLQPTKAALP